MSQIVHNFLITRSHEKHPELHDVIEKNGILSLEPAKSQDVFEYLAKTVVGQQLSNKAADCIWSRILVLQVEVGMSLMSMFNCGMSDRIRNCGLSSNKVKAIKLLHQKVTETPGFIDKILNAPYDEVVQVISSLWGFGYWSADMVAIFYRGFEDVAPYTDGALNSGLSKLFNERYTFEEAYQTYEPYRSYLSLHIWKGIDRGIIK